jgi:hypothetical protein
MHDLTGARKAPLSVLSTLFYAISLLTLGYLYWIIRARMTSHPSLSKMGVLGSSNGAGSLLELQSLALRIMHH